jgi:hypothetical protein
LKSEKLSSLKNFFWLVTKGLFFLPEEKQAALLIQEMVSHSEGNVLALDAGVVGGFGTWSSKKTKHDQKALLDLKIERCFKKDFALKRFLLFLIFIYP